MNRRTLLNKLDAYKYATEHEDKEWCDNIISELEAENYHTLLGLMLRHEWKAASDWIEKNL